MEIASTLSKTANVTIIGDSQVPFELSLGKEIGSAFQKLHTFNNIKFLMQSGVETYAPKENHQEAVGYVTLKSGVKVECDLVVLGVGVFPKTDYLKSSSITLDRDFAVTVDTFMQVPNASGVFAIGI